MILGWCPRCRQAFRWEATTTIGEGLCAQEHQMVPWPELDTTLLLAGWAGLDSMVLARAKEEGV